VPLNPGESAQLVEWLPVGVDDGVSFERLVPQRM